MQGALTALLLSDLGREAVKVVAGLMVVFVIVVAFTVSSVAALFEMFLAPVQSHIAVTQVKPSGAPPSGVVAIARTQLGMPYVWGGASPQTSFDCSGLVQWSYAQVGVALPRTAQQQYDATARISPDQLRPGDLVFYAGTDPSDPDFISHVGIYVGGGQMINAPDVGDVVREAPAFTGYWGAHFASAGRVGG